MSLASIIQWVCVALNLGCLLFSAFCMASRLERSFQRGRQQAFREINAQFEAQQAHWRRQASAALAATPAPKHSVN